MTLHICFSHGKESGPWGTKIRALAAAAKKSGHSVDSVDYRGLDDAIERVRRLEEHLAAARHAAPVVLVGSSYGGYVSACAAPAVEPAGLFLLAPAIYLPGFPPPNPLAIRCPVEIVHGHGDSVIPVADSLKFAGEGEMTLHAIAGDHRLIDALPHVVDLFCLALARFERVTPVR